jgi:hypothetical protein
MEEKRIQTKRRHCEAPQTLKQSRDRREPRLDRHAAGAARDDGTIHGLIWK